ncbi:efflux RND transporter permease subunit, partial [Escherichia coli]|uniref:efflux RND transporter permease subunit n=2 Tax=Enterobacterales TaxID=91347 RepID=UPI001C70253A
AFMFVRLPSSFLPAEDQGVFLSMVQLPPGSTQEQTEVILDEVSNYFRVDEGKNVESVFTVGGFSFAGAGQNMGLAFVVLKNWDERKGDENHVDAIVARANAALSKKQGAFIYAFNLPAIVELGTSNGFDFELVDKGGLGHDKLMEARNQLLGLAAQHPE